MDLFAYALLLVAILFGVIGQLLLKTGMLQAPEFKLKNLGSLLGNLPVISGFISYGISTLIYVKVLSDLDLSLAYPTVSLGYVIVVLLSKIFLKERVSVGRWAAVLIICAGVALVGFAGR